MFELGCVVVVGGEEEEGVGGGGEKEGLGGRGGGHYSIDCFGQSIDSWRASPEQTFGVYSALYRCCGLSCSYTVDNARYHALLDGKGEGYGEF